MYRQAAPGVWTDGSFDRSKLSARVCSSISRRLAPVFNYVDAFEEKVSGLLKFNNPGEASDKGSTNTGKTQILLRAKFLIT